MYGPDELRRLAFVKIAQHLGVPLQTAAAVLDTPRPDVAPDCSGTDRRVESHNRASAAGPGFLTHALHCPADHPARQCPTMTAALDSLVNGTTIDQLAAEHT